MKGRARHNPPRACAALAAVLLFFATASAGEFPLVEGRSPAAAFLITPGQAEKISECRIASEMISDFNGDLRECAGCVLPVLESDDGAAPLIRFAIEERPAEDEDRFGITFPDERTMLITGSTVSLRWALNHILQEFGGVRFLTATEHGAHFPRLDDFLVDRKPVSASPSFNLSRQNRFGENYWNRRMNNYFPVIGGPVYRAPCGHYLPLRAFPVQRYMRDDSWPDYIFPVVDGERYLPYKDPGRGERWQDYTSRWHPCFTDERVVEEAVKNLSAFFAANPRVYGTSIGINDSGGVFCECEGCKPLIGEGRTMTGHRDFSFLYYRWANRVAEGVAEKHPGRFLGTLAYREAVEPPDFNLHPSIVPHITYDIQQCEDPGVRAGISGLLSAWGERAEYVGRWEYGYGARVYQMPRVYFGLQQEMMRADYDAGVRAVYIERGGSIEDGPKKYLYHKLLWDVDLDLEATLRDWYEAAVGIPAAPYLAEYFRVWEEIWREEAVKTSWFQSSKHSVYLSMANQSYLYAVRPGDLEALAGLMERVVELAGRHGDRRQRDRAGWLMADFRYSEAVVYASGGDIFPPSGLAETAEQAIAYLERLPDAVRYEGMLTELHNERLAVILDPGFPDRRQPYVHMALAKVAGMASEPPVMEALISASENPGLPPDIRNLIGVFIRMEKGEPVDNLMLDGSFEEGNKDWRQGRITSERAYRGQNSLRLNLAPPFRSIVSAHGRDFPHAEVEPGKYYVSLMVYIDAEHPDPESYVRFRATPRRADGRPVTHFDSAHVNVPPGEWTRISLVADVSERADNFNLDIIVFHDYNRGDAGYIDDVVVAPIGR